MQRGLLARHASEDLVAFGARGVRTASDLLRDVAFVARALPKAPSGSEVTLVIRTDRYALAVAILAAWARDFVPVLPPELDREAITTLASAAETAAVLHDTASGIPLQIAALLAESERQQGPSLATDTWHDRALGSHSYARTGSRALARASWSENWLGQASALAELLAIQTGQRCATSVGTEHAHGIVLGVLVPLLTGASFLREPLAARALGAQLAAQAIDVLVSVPAHLPELLEGAGTGPHKLGRVISALGELSSGLRAKTSEALSAPVDDLSRAAGQVPILRCTTDASAPRTDHAALDLRVERFVLAQAGVRDAAVMQVGSGPASRLCVAVVADALDVAALKNALITLVDSPLVQLDLLSLGKIRRDGIGRAPAHELLRLFGLRPDGSAVNLALAWGETSSRDVAGGVEHRARVHVPTDYAYFDGHFSGYPILAGAAQLSELVLPCVRRVRPELIRLTQMSRLKFTGRIQPGETIDVVLSMRAAVSTVDFALKRGEALCSAGTLSFAPEEGR